MNNIEKLAEAKSSFYATKLQEPEELLEKAKEDYTAGYIAGAQRDLERLAFVQKQVAYLIRIASENDEFYSMSLAQYILEKIR